MKLKEFQKELTRNKIDLVFLTTPDPNIIYFTQSNFSHAHLIITPIKTNLKITKLDNNPNLKNISTTYLKNGWEKEIYNNKPITIGINENTLTIAFKNKLNEIFPKAKFKNISNILENLRSKKTQEEIDNIKKACKITSNAFNDLTNQLPPKKLKTEQDIAFFLEKNIKNQGATLAFPTIVAMDKNASTPHHITCNQKLKRGFLLMDFGANYKNYCADMTRMVFLGNPTKKEKSFYDLLLSSQQGAIDQIEENKQFSQLDFHARKFLGKYSDNFVHSLGHGIGIEVHEFPLFSNTLNKIQKNQVFTIEPGIYFPKQFGLRIEDTIAFNGKKKILTTASKELLKIH